MKTFILAIAFAAVCFAQDNAVIAADVSRSQASLATQSRTEQEQLVRALPEGTHCVLLTVGSSVRRVFEGRLDATRRAEAVRLIQAQQATAPNTNLGEALEEAAAIVAPLAGSKSIYFFTDGESRSAPGSRYRRRGFQEILDGFSLPAGTELYIRLFSAKPLRAPGPRVRLLTEPLNWAALVRPRQTPPEPLPPPPSWKPWLLACGAATAGFGVMILALWRRRALVAHADLTAPVEPAPIARPATVAPMVRHCWLICTRGGHTATLDGGGELLAGDSPLADLLLAEADGAVVRLTATKSALTVENRGGEVTIGRRVLRPGGLQALPRAHVQVRVGREVLDLFPETVQEDPTCPSK